MVATIALFASVGLAAFAPLLALTVGTAHGNESQRIPFQEKGLPWHPFQCKYRSVTSPHDLTIRVFERSGHTPQYEETAFFDAELLRWMKERE
jgi:hypothetical protein